MSQWAGLLGTRGCEEQEAKVVQAAQLTQSSWGNCRWKCYRYSKRSVKWSGEWVIGKERAGLLC